MTPRAAAELLGRKPQTIRKLVKDDKVEGTEVLTENGERRYYIAAEAVDSMLDGPPPAPLATSTPPEIAERYVEALETHNETLVAILEELRDHAARTEKRLEAVETPWWRRIFGS